MILDLILLTAIVVFVIDLSGWTERFLDIISILAKRRVNSLRPFTCSLCMSWWCGIAYLLATHSISITSLAIVAGLAFLTRPMAELFQSINDLIIKTIQWLNSSHR